MVGGGDSFGDSILFGFIVGDDGGGVFFVIIID